MADLSLDNVKTVLLGASQQEDGRWFATMMITYTDGKEPFLGKHPDPFATCDEAKAWQKKHVSPLLSMMYHDSSAGERPEGTVCGQYEWVDGKRVYCGEPATWHLPFPNGTFPDEFICDKHREELLAADVSGVMKNSVRRIN